MPRTTWRDRFRPKIAKVIQDHPDCSVGRLRRLLRAAGDFRGDHQSWRYRMWCKEVKQQLRLPEILLRPKDGDLPGQLSLFD